MTDDFWRADNGLRHDPIDDAWTLIARNRRIVAPTSAPRRVEGPASATAFDAEAALDRLPSLGQRTVGSATGRAVPSPSPLLFVEHPAPQTVAFEEQGALGAHELLALPQAPTEARAEDLSPDMLAALFALWSDRARDLSNDLRLQRVGLSLPPPAHRRSPLCAAHLFALPLPPLRDAEPASTCVVCSALAAAKAAGRTVLEADLSAASAVVAWVPFAPRHAAHVRVAAAVHGGFVADAAAPLAPAFGRAVATVAQALAATFDQPDLAIEIAPVALRASSETAIHLVIDVLASDDIDASAFANQQFRVCSLPPKAIAANLRKAIAAADL